MAQLGTRLPVIDVRIDRPQLVIEMWLANLRRELVGQRPEAVKSRRASRHAGEQRANNGGHAAAPAPIERRAPEPQTSVAVAIAASPASTGSATTATDGSKGDLKRPARAARLACPTEVKGRG